MPSKAATNALSAYSEHERLTAMRMNWWGIFLTREQRRLQAIAERVRAQETAQATGQVVAPISAAEVAEMQTPPVDGGTGETPDELLARLDGEEALAEIEASEQPRDPTA
jgi:hypothetical protein